MAKSRWSNVYVAQPSHLATSTYFAIEFSISIEECSSSLFYVPGPERPRFCGSQRAGCLTPGRRRAYSSFRRLEQFRFWKMFSGPELPRNFRMTFPVTATSAQRLLFSSTSIVWNSGDIDMAVK